MNRSIGCNAILLLNRILLFEKKNSQENRFNVDTSLLLSPRYAVLEHYAAISVGIMSKLVFMLFFPMKKIILSAVQLVSKSHERLAVNLHA